MPVGSEAILTEAREAVTHGCCCKCCSVRAEIWLCFAIDITSILGLALEIPNWRVVPARFHATDVYTFYLVLSVFSASLILYAQLSTNAWPRRALVRFMILKLAIFVVVVMGFFTVWPTAWPLAEWICANDFESFRTIAAGGDADSCPQTFTLLTTLNNAPYIFAYAYTLRAAHSFFRCHPGNDDLGVWCALKRDFGYTPPAIV